jgi:hypothetical protein
MCIAVVISPPSTPHLGSRSAISLPPQDSCGLKDNILDDDAFQSELGGYIQYMRTTLVATIIGIALVYAAWTSTGDRDGRSTEVKICSEI